MIFGIGTDIVCVSRMQKNLERYGDKFAERILTSDELSEYQKATSKPHFLAKRFAAKEATAKAMGTGLANGIQLSQIGVAHNEMGKPLLVFSGAAKTFLAEHAISSTHISLADEEEHAVAFVTLAIEQRSH